MGGAPALATKKTRGSGPSGAASKKAGKSQKVGGNARRSVGDGVVPASVAAAAAAAAAAALGNEGEASDKAIASVSAQMVSADAADGDRPDGSEAGTKCHMCNLLTTADDCISLGTGHTCYHKACWNAKRGSALIVSFSQDSGGCGGAGSSVNAVFGFSSASPAFQQVGAGVCWHTSDGAAEVVLTVVGGGGIESSSSSFGQAYLAIGVATMGFVLAMLVVLVALVVMGPRCPCLIKSICEDFGHNPTIYMYVACGL